MVIRTAGGMRLLEGQMVNSRAPEITIYLHTYLHVSFHRCGINSLSTHSALVLYEQACIAAAKLFWTAVIIILNSSETSGPLSNGRALMYS